MQLPYKSYNTASLSNNLFLKKKINVFYFFIMKVLRGKLIKKGIIPINFFKKLYLYIKFSKILHVPFQLFITISILKIAPFLDLYKAKLYKKGTKKIDKVKHITISQGIVLALNWVFAHLDFSKTLEMITLSFLFEICDAYFVTGRIFSKKLEHYKLCLDTRYFVK